MFAALALSSLFQYNAKAPLDIRQYEPTRSVDGITVRSVTYASPISGRVTAFIVAPRRPGRYAGVLYGHWALGDRAEFLPEAIELAGSGVVSILPDATFTRPPQWRVGAPGSALDHPEQNAALERHAVVDMRRALDVLVSQPDVDASRIAYVGHSFDASLGGILGAVDQRIRALVLDAGDGNDTNLSDAFLRGAWHALDNRTFLESSLSKGQVQHYLSAMQPFNADNFIGSIEAPIFMQYADSDAYVSRAMATDYARHAPPNTRVTWYVGGHELNDPRARRDRLQWLARVLKI